MAQISLSGRTINNAERRILRSLRWTMIYGLIYIMIVIVIIVVLSLTVNPQHYKIAASVLTVLSCIALYGTYQKYRDLEKNRKEKVRSLDEDNNMIKSALETVSKQRDKSIGQLNAMSKELEDLKNDYNDKGSSLDVCNAKLAKAVNVLVMSKKYIEEIGAEFRSLADKYLIIDKELDQARETNKLLEITNKDVHSELNAANADKIRYKMLLKEYGVMQS